MQENEITKIIIGASIEIHKTFGPGLLESAYERVLEHQLLEMGLKVEAQKVIPLEFKNLFIDKAYVADLVVEDKVIVELKSVEKLHGVHFKQLLTYLKLTDMNLGLLINFNEAYLKNGVKRVVNNFKEAA